MAGAALVVSIVSALGPVAAVWVAVWTHRQQGSRIECVWSNAYPLHGAEARNRRWCGMDGDPARRRLH